MDRPAHNIHIARVYPEILSKDAPLFPLEEYIVLRDILLAQIYTFSNNFTV